jgi:hypothetical protein
MHIELADHELRALVTMLLSEVNMLRDLLRTEERFNEILSEKLDSKDKDIDRLKAELKTLKPVKRGRPKKIVKRGPGRPKKVVA